MPKPLRVALPLGIGDCHWACQKLKSLSERENRPIHAYVNSSEDHISVEYLKLVPQIQKAIQSPNAPYGITTEMPPSHKDSKWSTLEGCRGWNGFDYILVANGHLESGKHIKDWLPELDTEYFYDLNILDKDKESVFQYKDRVVLYLSGIGPNSGFHNLTWSVDNWCSVVKMFNKAGVEPLIVGANTPSDLGYMDWFLGVSQDLNFKNIVGKTNIPQICQIMKDAKVWIGLNSGIGIVSAMMKTPTVMLWSDHNYPITGVGTYLHHNMQNSWLNEEQLQTYRTYSYGSPELTPRNVFNSALEVIR